MANFKSRKVVIVGAGAVGSGFAFALVARDDLRLGLDLQLAQLLAQARHGLLEFHQVEAERGNLLFEARTVDRNLAGGVDERVEQVRAHADHFLRRALEIGVEPNVAICTMS